jgi:UDP-N-acetylmuramoylalanine--D-glutamate ligase
LNLAGKRVVVMGLGRFGGGAGVTRFCVNQGAHVLLTDKEPEEKLAAGLALIRDLIQNRQIELHLGRHVESDFTSADVLVVNPAVPPSHPMVTQAVQAGVTLTSEIRLLVAHLPSRRRTIGITGSAGKSTTTAMVGHALERLIGSDKVHVGGNLGGSLLGQLDHIHPDHWVILELSSFMLHGLSQDHWSPHIAAITSFAPNHLDWHGSEADYRQAKQAIFDHQNPDSDIAILWPGGLSWFKPGVKDVRISAPASEWTAPLLTPGLHNRANAQMAAAIIQASAGVSPSAVATALEDFPGLPHRIQFVCEQSQVCYYNDSKATTPQATMLAIASFPPNSVHVILGGYDKASDLTAMACTAAKTCKAVYTIGQTGDTIAAAASAAPQVNAAIHRCHTLDVAVQLAVSQVHRGDVVLLSPGCASWGQFENYEQRGRRFAELVMTHTGEGAPNPQA